jgi:uncharacterized protein YecE (DUF72 family)
MTIRVGIGGWTYEPWRGTFYPDKWPHKRELEYAVDHVTAIEINSTYYSRQKPQSFAAWAKAAPEGFQFAVKASRFCTTRKVLAEAGEGITRFVEQGLVELGDKLGPILWQFMATKQFDPDDFGAFLKLLPAAHAGVPLRHAVHVRHDSFAVPEFVAMARARRSAGSGDGVVVCRSTIRPLSSRRRLNSQPWPAPLTTVGAIASSPWRRSSSVTGWCATSITMLTARG